MGMIEHEDPTKAFLDQTVPRDDQWDGREAVEGPARPRHVQHPVAPEPVVDPKVRRKETLKRAAWTFGPTLGYLAVANSLDDGGDAALTRAQPEPPAPEPADPIEQADFGDFPGGYGEAGSGL